MQKYKAIDLFCGCGGMRLGAESTGRYEFVYACDIDKFACSTYKRNFNEAPICADVRTLNKLPKHDILFAGFPCNSFAKYGVASRKYTNEESGLACNKYGDLIWEVLRLALENDTDFLFLENVKNLVFHKKGETFAAILDEFSYYGYNITWRIYNAYPYVPQNRYRTFMLCSKMDIPFFMSYPPTPNNSPVLGDILDKSASDKYFLSEHLWEYTQNKTKIKYATGGGFRHTICAPDQVTRALCARYACDGREILVDEGRSTPRKLTPKEAQRLMGFPDSFVFPVSDSQTYKQLGNSVVPPLVASLSNGMARGIDRTKRGVRVPTREGMDAIGARKWGFG